jgi:outer membrane protein OmpA-like peptidoglycan-associated protein
MTIGRATALFLLAGTLAGSACGPRRVAAPAPVGRSLIVLLSDPDGGSGARATVSNPSGAIELAADRDSTDVPLNQPPSAPRTLAAADVQRVFGDALAALPPAPRRFVLYFQFDSDELTEDARALVPEILRVVKERPASEVDVVGHTDTTGATEGNYELGLKRAATVRALLLNAGLDQSLLDVRSHGESDPMVRTPDNTYERRNRRVEVAVR